MGSDTVGAKPSVRFTEQRGVRISGVPTVCESMEIAFRTGQGIRIIADVRFSGVSARRGSTVYCYFERIDKDRHVHVMCAQLENIVNAWLP